MNDKPAENLSNDSGKKLPIQLSADEQNAETLEQLLRALDYADGFAIFIARCNVPVQRRQFIAEAKAKLAPLNIHVLELTFDQPIRDLRSHLRQLLADNGQSLNLQIQNPKSQELVLAEPVTPYRATPTPVIFISGLEFSIPFDDPSAPMLSELNLGRELFRRDAPYPLLFWLPDYAITSVARYAPDFWAWRSSVFEFESDEQLRSEAVRQLIHNESSWLAVMNLRVTEKNRRKRLIQTLLDDYSNFPIQKTLQNERAELLFGLGQINESLFLYDLALQNYQEALYIACELELPNLKITILNNIAGVYDKLGNKQKALEGFNEALEASRKSGYTLLETSILNNAGSVAIDLGDFTLALTYFEKALSLESKDINNGLNAVILSNIGRVYDEIGNKPRALDYYEQALLISRSMKDINGEAVIMNNIGRIYDALGQKTKALNFFENALSLHQTTGDLEGEAAIRHNMGLVYFGLGQFAKANEYYESSAKISHYISDRWNERFTRSEKAKTLVASGNLNQAVAEYELIVAIDREMNYPDLQDDQTTLSRIQAALHLLEGKSTNSAEVQQ